MFSLNIDKCLADMTLPKACVQMLHTLKRQTYINLGQFFTTLTTSDLIELSDILQLPGGERKAHILLLGMGLAMGEGLDIDYNDDKSLETVYDATITYIMVEKLYRNGLVRVFRENWTLSNTENKPIVGVID